MQLPFEDWRRLMQLTPLPGLLARVVNRFRSTFCLRHILLLTIPPRRSANQGSRRLIGI
jgi:hypothetical protein